MTAPHTQHAFDSADVEIAFRLFGSASPRGTAKNTPVLFVHGLSYFSYDWVDFGTRLCSDRYGCAMDMRGFGDSTCSPEADYSVPTMAADIGRLLDHLDWPQVLIVAHSMGGRSATAFAASHPAAVRGLVLVDWSPENAPAGSRRVATKVASTPTVFASMDEALRFFGVEPASASDDQRRRFEAYLRKVRNGYAIKRDPHFGEQFRIQLETGVKPAMGVNLWGLLAEIAVPTLVIRGTRSDLFAAETLPKVAASNILIETVEVEAGHDVAGDNPEATLAAIRHFIATLE
jgi:pimeloyl-ACP methyl ester carboxylesterase